VVPALGAGSWLESNDIVQEYGASKAKELFASAASALGAGLVCQNEGRG